MLKSKDKGFFNFKLSIISMYSLILLTCNLGLSFFSFPIVLTFSPL